MAFDSHFAFYLVQSLQTFSSEFLSLLTLFLCCGTILFSLRFLGLTGLYVYNVLAVLIANIQVLRGTNFFLFSNEPVALGTVVFATVFLADDIITEHYGKAAAQKSVWIGFSTQIFFTISMVLTIGFAPTPEVPEMHRHYEEMVGLFLPSIRLLVASLISYVVSQRIDIAIFSWLYEKTHQKLLWLRTILSSALGGLVDNVLFSLLAWVVLSDAPVSLHTLVFVYILGTYVSRLLVSFLSTPVLYLSYYFKPSKL